MRFFDCFRGVAQFDGLVLDVIENSGDFAPRRILADWLDDRGADAVDLEFCRLPLAGCPYLGRYKYNDPRYRDHLRRAREMLSSDVRTGAKVIVTGYRNLQEVTSGQPNPYFRLTSDVGTSNMLHPKNDLGAVIRYGWISEFVCSLDRWMKIGPTLTRRQPIVDVLLLDAFPLAEDFNGHPARVWECGSRSTRRVRDQQHVIPEQVWNLLANCTAKNAGRTARYVGRNSLYRARADLSAALVNWARRETSLRVMNGSPIPIDIGPDHPHYEHDEAE